MIYEHLYLRLERAPHTRTHTHSNTRAHSNTHSHNPNSSLMFSSILFISFSNCAGPTLILLLLRWQHAEWNRFPTVIYLQNLSQILINKASCLFLCQGWRPLLNWASFLEAAGAVLKIGLSLKLNHHLEIQLAQICETLCRYLGLKVRTKTLETSMLKMFRDVQHNY